MELQVKLEAKEGTELYLLYDNQEYDLYGDDEITISCSAITSMEIYSKPTTKQDLKHVWCTAPFRILLGFWDIFFSNTPDQWIKDVEPYVFSCSYTVTKPDITIKYTPSRYDEITHACRSPKIMVNQKEIIPIVTPNPLHAKLCFWKYCRHITSICFDGLLIWGILWILIRKLPVIWILLMVGTLTVCIYCIIHELQNWKKVQMFLPEEE
ncbi:hypothetical protein [Ruminococcus sp.]|uniref:hypothetical protein n=1 Tax=Ruminococcus sp. TaxID=41978 RepID=UPI0025EE45A4|nr:hypothetical protein [Ruminococcus sp.]